MGENYIMAVLVVEDEFIIRVMVEDELTDAGFDVLMAADADEAIIIMNA